MNESYETFRKRVDGIYKSDSKRGRATRKRSQARPSIHQDDTGHIVIRGARPRMQVPWTGLALLLIAFFGVKGAVIARFGPEYYAAQTSLLSPKTILEQVGAWTMRPDPISRWVALQIKSLS